MITRDVVEEEGLVDPEILMYVPETCDCGSPIIFTDSLKQIMCSNPRCMYKIASRLEAMAKAMQVDGFGESSCIEICNTFNLISPYQVFLLEGKSCPGVAAFEKKINAMINSPARRCELWQMVSYGSIPGIDQIAYKIFGSYKTIDEAFQDIEKQQVPFIAELLGQKTGSVGVMAVNVYETLIKYKDELKFGENKFNIIHKTGDRLQIAITDSVIGYPNKSAYIKELNMNYEGQLTIVRLNSVTNEVSYLIADGDKNSSKYRKALKMQEKGHPIKIVTSQEFKDILKEKYGGGSV